VGEVVGRAAVAQAADGRRQVRRASGLVAASRSQPGADQVPFGAQDRSQVARRGAVKLAEQLRAGCGVGQLMRSAGRERPRSLHDLVG